MVMRKAKRTLQGRGIAITQQRLEILLNIRRRYDHPNVEQVYKSLLPKVPKLSLDTVYRTLNMFAHNGLIMRVAAPSNRAHFDGCAAPHDHFFCTSCEKIIDLKVASDNSCREMPKDIPGVARIEFMQRLYLGICQECSVSAKKDAFPPFSI